MKHCCDAIRLNLSIVRRFLSRAFFASAFVAAFSFAFAFGQDPIDGIGVGGPAGAPPQGAGPAGAPGAGQGVGAGTGAGAATGRVGAAQTTSQNVAETQIAPYYKQEQETDANGVKASLGEPLTLERLLFGVYSPAERARRLYAYWDLSYKFAYYNLCKQTQNDVDACYQKVASKYDASNAPEAAVAYLNASRQIALERATSARLNLLQAQYNFDATFSSTAGRRAALARAAATGRRVDGESVLYAPSTPPATAAYRTRFEEMAQYRRLSEEAARLNALLPLLYETLQSRAAQASRARDALVKAFGATTLPSNDDALFNLVDAFFAAQDEALKAAARYNQAIAAYMAQTVPGAVQGEALLATLNQRPAGSAQSSATPQGGQGAGSERRVPQAGARGAFYPLPINRIPAWNDFSEPAAQATALVAIDVAPSYGLLQASSADSPAPRLTLVSYEKPAEEQAPVSLQASGEITPLNADLPKATSLTELTSEPKPEPTPEPKPQEEPKAEEPIPAPSEPSEPPKTEEPAPQTEQTPSEPPKEEQPPIVTQATPSLDEVFPIIVLITGYEQPQKSEAQPRDSELPEAPDGAFLPQERGSEFASFFEELIAEAVAESNFDDDEPTQRVERGQVAESGANPQRANENSEVAQARRAYAATRALFAIPTVDPSAQIEGEEERLFSLYEVAGRAGSSPAARSAVAKTYWRLFGAVARIRVEETIAQHYSRLLTISRDANAEAATTLCVSAVFEAQARAGEAKALKRLEQTNLLDQMGLTIATSSYPLPSTIPFCGMRYELGASQYESTASRGAGELVLERLKATREAGANFRSPATILGFDFSNINESNVEFAIAALKKQREQALLFVDLVVNLNCAIADYAAYFPVRVNSDRYVEALVGR